MRIHGQRVAEGEVWFRVGEVLCQDRVRGAEDVWDQEELGGRGGYGGEHKVPDAEGREARYGWI